MNNAINALRIAISQARNGHPIKAQGSLASARYNFAADILCPELYGKAVEVILAYAAAGKAKNKAARVAA